MQDFVIVDGYIVCYKFVEFVVYLCGLKLDDVLVIVLGLFKVVSFGGFNLIVDGYVVVKSFIDVIKFGNYFKVLVLVGNICDEGKFFLQLLVLLLGLGGVSGRLLIDWQIFDIIVYYDLDVVLQMCVEDWIFKVYLFVDVLGSGFDVCMGVFNDYWFVLLCDNVLGVFRVWQDGVWYYCFDWVCEFVFFDQIFGVVYVFDLVFMFGNFGLLLWLWVMFSCGNEFGRLVFFEVMMKSLGVFVYYGDFNYVVLGIVWL